MTGPDAPIIAVESISKWYGSVVAVNDVSLTVSRVSPDYWGRTARARQHFSK